MNTEGPTKNPVPAAKMFPAFRGQAETELLKTFGDLGLLQVQWNTHDEVREYPVHTGTIAFIPCTFVYKHTIQQGYSVLLYSEFLKQPWRYIPLFYPEDQLNPELVSRLAVEDLAPLFKPRQTHAEEDHHPKPLEQSIILIRIVAVIPLIATLGLAISYFYAGEVIFNTPSRYRWFRDDPPVLLNSPIDLVLFFSGWCLLSCCALVWGFRDAPNDQSSRLVWWTGYGGAELIMIGCWLAIFS